MTDSDRYLSLRIVHPPNDMDGQPPLKFAGRKIVLQVVDRERVVGYLGGVMDVTERFPLDGIISLELTVGAFYEAVEDTSWPSSRGVQK